MKALKARPQLNNIPNVATLYAHSFFWDENFGIRWSLIVNGEGMNHGIDSQQQLIDIESALQQELIANGVLCALLIDTAGNTIAEQSNGKSQYDTYAFAALAAGNYATVDSMAKLVGETDFAQLYHKGEKVSIHFSKMSGELLLITIFDNDLALGFLRLQVGELREKLQKICSTPAS